MTDELGFADDCGRYFARRHGLPPMTGRVLGFLLVCDPPAPTVGELADALHASRTAVTQSVTAIEAWSWVARSRTAGERVDRVRLDPDIWTRLVDTPEEYLGLRALADAGLSALADTPRARRERLIELAAFADFVAARAPQLADEWRAELAALRANNHRRQRRKGAR